MAENIKSRKYYRVHNGTDWDRMHFVTDANSVDANDGDTMETKVGAIKGITTSTEVTEEGYAADATVVAALNSSLGKVNNNLGGLRFYEDSTGKYVVGADSVPKKLGKSPITIPTFQAVGNSTASYQSTIYFTLNGDYETLTIGSVSARYTAFTVRVVADGATLINQKVGSSGSANSGSIGTLTADVTNKNEVYITLFSTATHPNTQGSITASNITIS